MNSIRIKADQLELILGSCGFRILPGTSMQIAAQYKEKEDTNYGNTPDKQVPYGTLPGCL